ncbi:MAG: amino acid adenylation domain-containing protein [Candidatus Aminicenantes bacterium]|nr:MAG: amino acid adenylation domain-containing protein [Candidatus Aminicenantes bacterium]
MTKLTKKNIEDIFALTPMQEGMLLHYLQDPDSEYFFEQLILNISGNIDVDIFQKAWHVVVENNGMLRTVFRWHDLENPVQITLKKHEPGTLFYDFTGIDDNEKKKSLENVIEKDRLEKFDLRQVPFRVTLCKTKEDEYEMIISHHHLLFDGWSNGIILKEFFNAYNGLAAGKNPVKPLKNKFKEFVKWNRDQDTRQQEKYWSNYLKGFDTRKEFPGKQIRKGKTIKNVKTFQLRFDNEVKEKWESFVKTHNITIADLLYSGWGLLLQRCNHTSDVLFHTTVSGRNPGIKGIEDIVGMFINTLPLRVQTRSPEKTAGFLARTHDDLQQRREFENSSLTIVNEYLDQFPAQTLFDSVLVIENYPLDTILMQENSLLSVNSFTSRGMSHYDITLIITLFSGICLDFTFHRDLFDEEIMVKLAYDFYYILEGIIENPHREVNQLTISSEAVRERLLARYNGIGTGGQPGDQEYAAPGDRVEETLVEIWAELFRVDKAVIGIDANFFDFGGHSLKAAMLAAKMLRCFNVPVPLPEIFRRPTIRELAQYIKPAAEEKYIPIKPLEKKQYYPAASAQKRLYMLQQLDLKSTVYNGPLIMILEGEIQKEHMEQSFRKLIDRHESLRTSFKQHFGEPVQKVHDPADIRFALQYHDLTLTFAEVTKEKSGQENSIAALGQKAVKPFDLSQVPLLRVELIKIKEQKHLFIVDMHHIITDGTSTQILLREFGAIYRGEQLSPLKIHYRDFCVWQHERFNTGKLKHQEEFWFNHLQGELPVLDMPTDYLRPALQHFEGNRIRFEIEEPLTRQVKALMKKTGTTLYMVLLAVYNILLGCYTGQEDIIVGTPIAGRNDASLEDTVGLFLETLAVRTYPLANKLFDHFLTEIKTTALDAYENRDYPFGELLEKLEVRKDLSRNPVFDAMLNVLNQDTAQLEIEGVTVIPFDFTLNVSKVDFTLEAREVENKVILELEYSTALFRKETMERFSRHFSNTLERVVNQPLIRLSAVEILGEEEKKQLLEEFNGATIKYTGSETFIERFAGRVQSNPDYIALVGRRWDPGSIKEDIGEKHISYKELNKRANQLAHVLRDKGVKPDTLVGMMMERSPDLIIGILGILKSSAAYLPLDAGYPEERLRYMLKDSNAQILLTGKELEAAINFGGEIIEYNHEAWNFAGSSDPGPVTRQHWLAYVIYTSGSTGKPKGVMVNRENLMGYLYSFEQEFKFTTRDVVIQQASYSFDAFGEEVFPCLLQGGKMVVIFKEDLMNITFLSGLILNHNVTVIDCSPLLLNELNKLCQPGASNPLNTIRLFISGGDVLKREYIDNLIKIGTVYNTYGPTETTICAAYHQVNRAGASAVPIGRPITNYRLYILNRHGHGLPIGVPGEICISGVGVSRGYLNQPGLTREKFVLQSWFPGEMMYKTGDLGKWLADGNIEFLGRLDRQVNIRGFRIELEEIERQLQAHEHIDKIQVVPVEGHSLCAYFTSKKEENPGQLRHSLSLKFPGYMIPDYFVQLQQMPLTPQGKIDTRALPEPGAYSPGAGAQYIPPGSESEKKLAKIWQEILGLETISITDNFFELGGNSIRMIQAIVRIREEMRQEVAFKTFFRCPTIKSLSRAIVGTKARDLEVPPIKPVSRDRRIPLSFSQEQIWILQQLYQEYMSYHVPRAIRIKGDLDVSLLERTFTGMIKRHEILRTVFPAGDSGPEQHILEPFEFKIPVMDMRGLAGDKQANQVSAFILAEGQRKFHLDQGPLLRVTLLKLGDTEHMLVFCEHHLIHDGWSQGILLGEFLVIFEALLAGKASPLPALPIQYADFACWQRDYFQGEILEQWLDYWKEKLSGLAPLLELPTDRPRPPVISGKGADKIFYIPAGLTRALDQYSRENGVTLFMTMLAAFKVLMYRYTGTADLCVGTAVANRKHKEMEGMLGMVINTIALRTEVPGGLTFNECLQRVKNTCLEAYQHEEVPFEKIVEGLRPERSLSYMPIFQVMFSFMDTPTHDLVLPGLELHLENAHNRSSKFDIDVVVVPNNTEAAGEDQEGTLVEWEYNTDIFESSTIERMVNHYYCLVREIIRCPGEKISAIPMMEKAELEQILYQFNHTEAQYPKNKSLHQLFAEQVERTGDHIAIVGKLQVTKYKLQTNEASYRRINAFGEIQLSYSLLNEKSDQMAYILWEKGIKPGTITAIMAAPSIEMIIGILGILKAGGAYLAIDPEYPEERIDFMLKDSGTGIRLTTKEIVFTPEEFNRCPKGTAFHPRLSPGPAASLAYVAYTSSAAGKPKGAAIEHLAIVNTVVWRKNYYCFQPDDVVLQLSAISSGSWLEDIFTPLTSGARLFLLQARQRKDTGYLKKLLITARVTYFLIVPALYKIYIEEIPDSLAGVRCVTLCGEHLSEELVKRHFKRLGHVKLYHQYGPGENSGCTTVHAFDPANTRVLVGKPISNVTCYILDNNGQVSPIGAAGELCLSGHSLARGYLNDPELTAEKFCLRRPGGSFCKNRPLDPHKNFLLSAPHSPYSPHSPIYKTNDLARWLPGGSMEFLGRRDQQVKIRGFRIEVGEIENQLLKHDEIKDAVVITKQEEHEGNIEKYLRAYFVSERDFKSTELRKYLSHTLPDYMIPSYFVRVEAMPLTPQGEIDKESLALIGTPPAASLEHAQSQTDVEKILTGIWQEVLKRDKIGIHDNFFDLGGNSLNLIHLNNKLREVLKIEIPVVSIYKYMTISSFIQYLDQEEILINKFETETDRSSEIEKGRSRLKKKISRMRA